MKIGPQTKNKFYLRYYLKHVRLHLLSISIGSLLIFFLMSISSQHQIELIGIFVLFILFYVGYIGLHELEPIRKSLSKLSELEDSLSYEKYLEIIYQQSEWELLNALVDLAQKNIKKKGLEVENLNRQSKVLLESIPSAIVTIDLYQNIQLANKYFERNFIKDKEITVLGAQRLWMLFDDTIVSAFENALKGANNSIKAYDVSKNNHYYNIEVTPLKDRQEKTIGALGIFHDVTQLKLADKMKVDFVANVSHEIKTPLTSIKGYAQLLLADPKNLNEMQIESLNIINQNVEKFKKLFENVMELSKIESSYALNISRCSLHDIIETSPVKTWPKAKEKPLSIETQLDIDLINADVDLLNTIFNNLFSNALKYNDKKELKILISSKEINNRVLISFEDNGPGVTKQERSRIFERFFRSPSQSLISGNGLGLALVKHIVVRHGGEIQAHKSKELGGLKIDILLDF